MKTVSRISGLLLTTLCLAPGGVLAQTVGGAVPPYEPPPPVQAAPQRIQEGTTITPSPSSPVTREDVFRSQDQLIRDFSAAYQKAKRPRIAIFWNRELSDARAIGLLVSR